MEIPEVIELEVHRFGDERGFFSETYNREQLREVGIEVDFVQDNHSLSGDTGTLRGLHFQLAPFAQDKLVRVTKGSVFDVAVDIREGSSTFGKWVGVEISAKKWNQLFVPKGFAHGFVTLEPDTEFLYKVSAPYAKEAEGAIRFDDPDIGVAWPLKDGVEPVLSAKDKIAPLLRDLDVSTFNFGTF